MASSTGKDVLMAEDVLGCKRFDDVAKSSHDIDLHGKGADQERIPVTDGRSYDVPFRF